MRRKHGCLLVLGGLALAFFLASGGPQAAPPHEAAGDPLPEGALARFGSLRLRHPRRTSPVFVTFSPDGKVLASRSDDNIIRLWDPASGRLLHALDEGKAGVSCLAFSADSKTLASGGAGSISLWDVATGRQLRQFPAHEKEVTSIAFAPDGLSLVSGSTDKTVRQWETASGKEVRQLGENLDAINGVAFSPDGKVIAAGSRRSTVYLFDPATGKETGRLAGDGSRMFAVAFSPDSKTLAVGSRTIIHLWDHAAAKELRQFGRPVGDDVTSYNHDESLAFSPDGTILASGGKKIRFWNTATAKELRSFSEPRRRVSSVSFSADGKHLASGSVDQEIRLWDAATGKELRQAGGHQDRALCAVFSPDGKLAASGGLDHSLYLWDAVTGKLVRPLEGHTSGVTLVSFSADGKLLVSADGGGMLRVWEVESGKEVVSFQAHQARVSAAVFSPDGKKLASAGEDRKVRLYDIAKDREVCEFPDDPEGITALAFSPNGKNLAGGTSLGKVRLWNASNGESIQKPEQTEEDDDPFMLMPQPMAPPPIRGAVQQLMFTPGGKLALFWLSTGAFGLYDATTGKVVRQFDGPPGGRFSAGFSPDGKTLAVLDGNRRLSLRETATGAERRYMHGHPNGDFIESASFSPDGRRLMSAGEDTTVLIWDVTGRLRDGKLQTLHLTPKQLDAAWAELAGEDGFKAYQGVWDLVASAEEALPFLAEKLKPVKPDPKHIDKLIADLDANQFPVREKARAELEELAELAEAALKKALAGKPPLEMETRIRKLLAKVEKERYALSPHRLRVLRVTESLEQIGNEEAKRLLESIAAAPPELRLTDEVKLEAKASLRRLARR